MFLKHFYGLPTFTCSFYKYYPGVFFSTLFINCAQLSQDKIKFSSKGFLMYDNFSTNINKSLSCSSHFINSLYYLCSPVILLHTYLPALPSRQKAISITEFSYYSHLHVQFHNQYYRSFPSFLTCVQMAYLTTCT